MKKANVITGVVFLALSIFAYMQAQKMVGKIMTDALGPGFWPKVLGLVMGVLSLALIVEGLFGKQAEGEKAPIAFGTEGFHRVLKLFAVLIVFGAILYFLGIYVGILFTACSSLVIQAAGATAGMKRREDVEKFIRSQPKLSFQDDV